MINFILAAIPVLSLCISDTASPQYPETLRGDTVELMHGVEVADPYRWLEGDVREHEDVSDWVDQQNEVTFAHLHAIPERAGIRDRIESLWNYPKTGRPMRYGDR